MRKLSAHATLVAVNMTIVGIAIGCQSSSLDSNRRQPALMAIAGTPVVQQLIIKFKPNTFTCDLAGIAQLSAVTGLQLRFIRPMSSDACVITQISDGFDGLLLGQKRLEQNSAIERVEKDAVMKAF
jgi:hypothetical protein